MRKALLILLGIVIIGSIVTSKVSKAEEQGASTKTVLDEMTTVIKKMDELSKNQEEILKQIAEIKEELKIIKMRTALR